MAGKKHLQNDARERLVAAYLKLKKASLIAVAYDVSERTVYRLVHQKRETGSADLRTCHCGRKPKVSSEQVAQVKSAIMETPDITLQELIDKLHLPCGVANLCIIVRHKLGFTRKRKTIYAEEQVRPRCGRAEGAMETGGIEV